MTDSREDLITEDLSEEAGLGVEEMLGNKEGEKDYPIILGLHIESPLSCCDRRQNGPPRLSNPLSSKL